MNKKTSFSTFLIWASMVISMVFMGIIIMKDLSTVLLLTTIVSGTVGTIGVWLGMDMSAAINLTGSLPSGQFVPIDSGKYVASMTGLLVLFIFGMFMEYMTTVSYETPLAILAGGLFSIVMVYVGGIKAVKKKTGIAPGYAA